MYVCVCVFIEFSFNLLPLRYMILCHENMHGDKMIKFMELRQPRRFRPMVGDSSYTDPVRNVSPYGNINDT